MADKSYEKIFCDLLSGELGRDNLRQCGGAGTHKVFPCCMCGGAGPHYILAFVAKGSWALWYNRKLRNNDCFLYGR